MPHCSSPFLRIGAIHSIPDASREVYFGTRHQRLNRMTLQQSPASSHDLARICYFWTSSRVRRTASAGVHGPGSVFLLHVRRVLRDCISQPCGGVEIARKRPVAINSHDSNLVKMWPRLQPGHRPKRRWLGSPGCNISPLTP